MKALTKRLPAFLVLCMTILPIQSIHAQADMENLPIEPILPVIYQGWSNALELANATIRVVVVPETGRIAFLGPNKEQNVLNINKQYLGVTSNPDDDAPWLNYGGDWMWPVSQKYWPVFQDGNWPPSRLLDGRPWSGRAWLNADGSKSCLLQQTFSEPLNIKVTRLMKLPVEGSTLVIEQRIEGVSTSSVPVSLWNISQIAKPDQLVFSSNPTSAFLNKYVVMMGPPAPTNLLKQCENAFFFDTEQGTENKFGADPDFVWIAALRDNLLIVEQVETNDTEGTFPDGGCSVELYFNKGLGYAEIETLSVEKILQAGESIANVLTIRLSVLEEKPATPEALLKEIKTVLND